MMRFKTTDSPWAGKKAEVCMMPILTMSSGLTYQLRRGELGLWPP